jgi:hypothetical protein
VTATMDSNKESQATPTPTPGAQLPPWVEDALGDPRSPNEELVCFVDYQKLVKDYQSGDLPVWLREAVKDAWAANAAQKQKE